jgi:branched-subunit amino acid transport protein
VAFWKSEDIAPAILTALIVPTIFTSEGRVDISLNNYYIPAAAITILVAYFSKSMLASIITGLCTVGLLTWLL